MENLKEMEKDNRLICLFILFFVNIKFIYGWKERGNEGFFLKKVLVNLREPDSTFSYTCGNTSLSQIYLIT